MACLRVLCGSSVYVQKKSFSFLVVSREPFNAGAGDFVGPVEVAVAVIVVVIVRNGNKY